jgi:hypothetical protein
MNLWSLSELAWALPELAELFGSSGVCFLALCLFIRLSLGSSQFFLNSFSTFAQLLLNFCSTFAQILLKFTPKCSIFTPNCSIFAQFCSIFAQICTISVYFPSISFAGTLPWPGPSARPICAARPTSTGACACFFFLKKKKILLFFLN